MSKKSKSAKCPIPKRIRRRLQVTLDPDIYNRIKESGVNASRLIDKAVSALFSHVDPVYLLVSSKEAQKQWARRELNPRPPGYEPGALTGGIDKRGDIYEDLETGESFGDAADSSGKTEAGDKFYVINLDDAIDYITHGIKRQKPVKPLSTNDKTGKGAFTAIKYFLSFGDIISQTIEGQGKNAEITERTARITYKTVRAYNVAQNAKSGGETDTGYVKRFLQYLGRSKGDSTLQEWGNTLEYEYSGIEDKTLYAKPGEKGYVTLSDAIEDMKKYYQELLTAKQQPGRVGAFRQLVTAMWGLSTGMRPIETTKVEWDHLKTAVEQGYFEAPPLLTKTGEGRVIPLHPQIKPFIELLIEAGEQNPRLLPQPFNTDKFRTHRPKSGAKLVLAQYRNLPVVEWRNHGIDPIVRLAIMGHDQQLVMDALRTSGISTDDQARILAQEQEAAGKMTQTYGRLQPAGIAAEYHRTVGKWKFIPREIDIKQIAPLLEPKVRRPAKKKGKKKTKKK